MIALWLLVVFHGIAFGAGAYEIRIVVPMWFAQTSNGLRVNSQAMADIDVGRKFWGFVSTGPLTLIAIANAVVLAMGPRHDWWLAAVLITFVERAFTFSYFIPTAIRLQRGAMPTEVAAKTASTWSSLNVVRMALSLAAWLSAIHALTLGR